MYGEENGCRFIQLGSLRWAGRSCCWDAGGGDPQEIVRWKALQDEGRDRPRLRWEDAVNRDIRDYLLVDCPRYKTWVCRCLQILVNWLAPKCPDFYNVWSIQILSHPPLLPFVPYTKSHRSASKKNKVYQVVVIACSLIIPCNNSRQNFNHAF